MAKNIIEHFASGISFECMATLRGMEDSKVGNTRMKLSKI